MAVREGPFEIAPVRASASRTELQATILIVCVTLLTLWPLCGADFTTWDDPVTVYKNPTLNPPTLRSLEAWWTRPVLDLWDPVTDMVRGALAMVATTDSLDPVTHSRLNPYVYHTANLLVHVATSLIIFRILLLLLRLDPDGNLAAPDVWAACGGAILFAIHPVQVESVGWVTALKDLLCGLFSCAAVFCYLSETKTRKVVQDVRSSGWGPGKEFWLATAFYFLATLSKPTAVVVPAIVLALNGLLWRPWRRTAGQMFFWGILAIPCIVVTAKVQIAGNVTPLAFWKRPLIAADAIAFYLYKLVWPARLGLDYGRTPARIFQRGWVWWTWVAPFGLFLLIFLFRRRVKLVAIGASIFVLGLLPVLGFVRFDFQQYSTVSDHYLYLSMLGIAMAAASGLRFVRTRWAIGMAATVLTALAARAFVQTWTWQSNDSLYLHALELNPDSFAAAENIADVYAQAHRSEEAIRYARQSIAANAHMANSWASLGDGLNQEGKIPEATEAFRRAYEIEPNNPICADDLGSILAFQKKYAEALTYFRRACQLKPDFARSRQHLALLLEKLGQTQSALDEFQTAVHLDPQNGELHGQYANLLAKVGRIEEARQECLTALQYEPNLVSTRNLLASLPKP